MASVLVTDYLSRIGVNTHLNFTGSVYDGTTNRTNVKNALNFLNIHLCRDLLPPSLTTPYTDVAGAGNSFEFIVTIAGSFMLTPAQVVTAAKSFLALPGMAGKIVALEGTNEVDLQPLTYGGGSAPANQVQYHTDLFAALNADSTLNPIPVVAFSVGQASAATFQSYGNISSICDVGNSHTYANNGSQPSYTGSIIGPDWQYLNLACTYSTPDPKPTQVTESGYSSDPINHSWSVTNETVKAKLALNLILSPMRFGFAKMPRFFYYELGDWSGDAGWGLYDPSWNIRPAGTAIHNFTTVLLGTGTPTVSDPSYSVSGLGVGGFQYLFARPDTSRCIVVWAEPDIWDDVNRVPITAATRTVTFTFASSQNWNLYDPMIGTTSQSSGSGTIVNVVVQDHPLILTLAPIQSSILVTDYLSRIGINTHFNFTGSVYDGTANRTTAKNALNFLNIHLCRDILPFGFQQAAYQDIAGAGNKFNCIVAVSGGMRQPVDVVNDTKSFLALPGMAGKINSLEGPNEVDFQPLTYGGASTVAAQVSFQHDWNAAVKADGTTSAIPVICYSIGQASVQSAYTPYGDNSANCNYGVAHIYCNNGNQPAATSLGIDTYYQWAQPLTATRPVTITETGYSSDLTGGHNWSLTNEPTKAKLILNTILTPLRYGFSQMPYLFLYELGDWSGDAGFGLYDPSWNIRQAGTAVHNFTTVLLASGTPSSDPSYTVSGLGTLGFQYLMTRADGSKCIIVWAEPDIWNESTLTPIVAATRNVTFTFTSTVNWNIYDPIIGTTSQSSGNGTVVVAAVVDHPLIITVDSGTINSGSGQANGAGVGQAFTTIKIGAQGISNGNGVGSGVSFMPALVDSGGGMPENSRIANMRDIDLTLAKYGISRTAVAVDSIDYHIPGNTAGSKTLDIITPAWVGALMPLAGWITTGPGGGAVLRLGQGTAFGSGIGSGFSTAIVSPPPSGTGTINIPDANTLYTTLNQGVAVIGGKTLLLAANTSFGQFYCPVQDFRSNPIVIQGQTGTTFTAFGGSLKGIAINNITSTAATDIGFAVGSGCDIVTFNNCVVNTGTPEGTQLSQGYQIRNATNVTVNGKGDSNIPDITGCGNAMSILTSDHVTVNNITITNNGSDGVLFSGATNLTLNGIIGYNFYGDLAAGDHPDFIQGFDAGFGQPTNVLIKNCGWLRANGVESQGYFFEDCYNITVQNCWLYGGMFNSIAIARGTTALFDNNYVVGFADYGSWILARGAYVNCTVTNNFTGAVINYAGDGVNPGFIPASGNGSNTIIGSVTAGDYSGLDAWLALPAHAAARKRPGASPPPPPAVVASVRSTSTLGFAARTNTVLTKPPGTVSGDFLVAVIFSSLAGFSALSITPPTGWTAISSPVDLYTDATPFTGAIQAFKHAVGSADPASYTFTHGAANTESIMYSIIGADLTQTPTQTNNSVAAPAVNNIALGLSITAQTNSTVVIDVGYGWNSPSGATVPTGYSQNFIGTALFAFSTVIATAGASGNVSTTLTNNTLGSWGSSLIAVRSTNPIVITSPPPPPPPPPPPSPPPSPPPPSGTVFRPPHGALIWQYNPATFQARSDGNNNPADPKYNNLANPILMSCFSYNGAEQTNNNELGYYVDSFRYPGTTAWFIDGNGNLVMQSQKLSDLGMPNIVSSNSGRSYAYTSSVLQAYFAHTLYGYFETTCQSTTAQGTWPAFWLLPYPNGWPPEIDVFEHYRDGGARSPGWVTTATNHYFPWTDGFEYSIIDLRARTVQFGAIGDKPGPSGTTQNAFPAFPVNIDLTVGQHVHGCDWRADFVTWYIDGIKIWQQANTTFTPMFPLWDVTVGGSAGPVNLNVSPNPGPVSAQMIISSISIYS